MKKLNNDVELIILDKHNMKPLIDYINELQGYKERIEKAVEYINKKWKEHTYYERNENHLGFCEFSVFEKNDLLNILRGEEKENG